MSRIICRAKDPWTCRYHGVQLSSGTHTLNEVGRNSTTARQAHGFKYEELVKSKFNLSDYGSATDPWDAKTPSGRLVNIKTKAAGKAVEFGSWHRHLEVEEDFYLVIGFWTPGDKSKIVEELLLDVPADEWRSNFPSIYTQKIKELFTGVSHDRDWDEEWTKRLNAFQAAYQELKEKHGWIVNLNPKRDHKSQLRMQCSIPYADIKNLHKRFKVAELK